MIGFLLPGHIDYLVIAMVVLDEVTRSRPHVPKHM
jgi:hypothetical protein